MLYNFRMKETSTVRSYNNSKDLKKDFKITNDEKGKVIEMLRDPTPEEEGEIDKRREDKFKSKTPTNRLFKAIVEDAKAKKVGKIINPINYGYGRTRIPEYAASLSGDKFNRDHGIPHLNDQENMTEDGIINTQMLENNPNKNEDEKAATESTPKVDVVETPTVVAKEKEDNAPQVEAKAQEVKEVFEKQEEEKAQKERLEKKLSYIGMSLKDMSSVEGWDNLSMGQKFMTAEQIEQHTLRSVKEEGKKRFEDANKIALKTDGVGKTAGKLWNHIRKSYWISREEKNVIDETREGLKKPDEKTVKDFIAYTSKMDLPIEEKNFGLTILFEKNNKELGEGYNNLIDTYNKNATAFAKMPDAWKNERAANSSDEAFFEKTNYKEYIEAKSAYEESRKALIEYRKEASAKEGVEEGMAARDAMNNARDTDFTIAILQFNQTNPAAGLELDRIERKATAGRFFGNENTARATYMAVGFAMRRTFGIAAAPIVAGVMGGIRALRKANQKIDTAVVTGREQQSFIEIQKQKKDGTYIEPTVQEQGLVSKVFVGGNITTKEAATFIDADSQVQRLENLMAKFDSATPEEKKDLKSQIETRLMFIEQKHKEGFINYGKENPTGANYALMKTLSEAEVKVSAYTEDSINWEELKGTYIETLTTMQMEDVMILSIIQKMHLQEKDSRD
jgi:hypothetical protein